MLLAEYLLNYLLEDLDEKDVLQGTVGPDLGHDDGAGQADHSTKHDPAESNDQKDQAGQKDADKKDADKDPSDRGKVDGNLIKEQRELNMSLSHDNVNWDARTGFAKSLDQMVVLEQTEAGGRFRFKEQYRGLAAALTPRQWTPRKARLTPSHQALA